MNPAVIYTRFSPRPIKLSAKACRKCGKHFNPNSRHCNLCKRCLKGRGGRPGMDDARPLPPPIKGVSFRKLDGLDGYAFGSDGSAWTAFRGWKKLRPYTTRDGYKMVTIYLLGKAYVRTVHSLVMLAFAGEPPRGMEIRHLDGVKSNNSRANLAYGTRSENSLDALRHGTHPGLKTHGERCSLSKLRIGDVRKIRTLSSRGMSPREIAQKLMLGVHEVTIRRVVTGATWRRSL